MKRKLKGWKKADRFYILNMQRGNAFTKEEDTFQMKIIKRLLSFIFLCVIIAGGVLGYKGYEEYKKALSEESVKEMAARIEEQPNYTTIDELPQTYIDAVLSVEDKRFYDHFGSIRLRLEEPFLMISKRELCRRRQHDHPAACKKSVFYAG